MSTAGVNQESGVFVGRRPELAKLGELLSANTKQVLFLHGLAGAGKSYLARRFVRTRSGDEREIILLDCGEIEPTEQGFLAALLQHVDEHADANAPLDGVLELLPEGVVVCLDQYEVFRLLDSWLRNVFVPALPDSAAMLIIGREAPHRAWTRIPTGSFSVMELGPLPHEDSVELIAEMGVDQDQSEAITKIARGHPLTLVVGALAALENPGRSVRSTTMSRLLEEFALAYLDDLDDATRSLLQAASVVRRVSRPLLEAILSDDDAWKGYETLRPLPFMETTTDGLAVHDAMRQVIATAFRAAEPDRYRALRQKAWTYLRNQLREAPRSELWRHTADMIFLLENPNVREAHFPSGSHQFAIETATPADESQIQALIDQHETPESAEILRSWWSRQPEAFRMARDWRGQVGGFSIITTTDQVDLRRFEYDPIVSVWRSHLDRNPIPRHQKALLIRRWLSWDVGDLPSEPQASMWLDLKRTYMQLRPNLRRNYGATDHPEIYGPVMEQLGGGVIPNGIAEIGGRAYYGLYLEFGPSSVDGWLTRLAAEELGLPEDDLLDVNRRQLILRDRRVDLTPKEFEVLHYLREREGEPISRIELLGAIWGHGDDFGSNVVDAVIYSLRQKLAERSDIIDTVRGLGYRLTPT